MKKFRYTSVLVSYFVLSISSLIAHTDVYVGTQWHHPHERVYASSPWYHPDHVYYNHGYAYPHYYYGYPYYYYDPRYYYWENPTPSINVNVNIP